MANWKTLKTDTIYVSNTGIYMPIGIKYDDDSWQLKATHTTTSGQTLTQIAQMYSMTLTKLKELNNITGDTVPVGTVLTINAWSVLLDIYMTNSSTNGGYYSTDSFTGSLSIASGGSIGNGTIKNQGVTSQSTFYRSSANTSNNGIRVYLQATAITASITSRVTSQNGSYKDMTASLSVPTRLLNSILGTIPNFIFDGNENIGVAFNVPCTKNNSSYTDKLIIKIKDPDTNILVAVATRENYVSGDVTFTSSELAQIYSLMSKVNSTDFTFELSTYNGTTQIGIINTKTAVGTISETGRNPTVPTVILQETNSKVTSLCNTGTFVKGYSNIRFTVDTKAKGNKGATITGYRVVFENQQVEFKEATTSVSGIINGLLNKDGYLYAIDSRENTSRININIPSANFLNYVDPVITNLIVTRDATGTATTAKMNVQGTFWNNNFGKVKNTLNASYQYRVSGTGSYSTAKAITLTLNNNNFSFNAAIQGDLAGNGFTLAKNFDILVTVIDSLSGDDEYFLLQAGKPNIAVHPDGVSINAPYNETIGGPLQINGQAYLEYDIVDTW